MTPPAAPTPPIDFAARPPERRTSRTSTPALAGACTCCCCCCLHTVGGLIGAAVAPAWTTRGPRTQEQDDYEDFQPGSGPHAESPREGADGGPSAVRSFWVTLLVLVLLGFLVGPLMGGGNGQLPTNLVLTAVVILMVLPALQLVAAAVAAVFVAVSGGADRGVQLRRLGRIALGVFLGTMAGMLAMVILYFALSRIR